MTETLEVDYAALDDPGEAERRAKRWKSLDPYPDVHEALLSSEHIKAYVKQTAMIHPFYDDRERMKPASYEMRPGGSFIRWDAEDKHVQQIKPGVSLVLPANSITFVQTESMIRLPDFIAMRFNLRIKHVHRGLLLGTGPLVDPGFQGHLLIPLHNLTSAPYTITSDEGLIWIEFTKTSHASVCRSDLHEQPNEAFGPIPEGKTNKPVEYYFEKASGNRPIKSSIPDVITEVRKKASDAQKDAKDARRANQIFAGIGFIAVLGVFVGLLSFLNGVDANQRVSDRAASEAKFDAKRSLDEVAQLKAEVQARRSTPSADVSSRTPTDFEGRLSDLEAALAKLLAAGVKAR